ncbi:MAG TPA: response regulator [Lacibacter sp.]|nr:response regulator [Lacibacter sp.]
MDDSIELLEMFEMLFKLKGFGIHTASNLDSFMKKIGAQKPDLIIMDIMLGAQDGRQLCMQLKSQSATKEIPVIIMSASANKLEDHREYLADDILEKPFALTELLGKLDNLLATKKQTLKWEGKVKD